MSTGEVTRIDHPHDGGDVIWTPTPERAASANLTAFMAALGPTHGSPFSSYESLWQWSVDHLEEFWATLTGYFGVLDTHDPSLTVLERGAGAEGAVWFPGAETNYADRVVRQDPSAPALIACTERADAAPVELTYGELLRLAGAVAASLRRLGVGPGDRVVAVLPNSPAAVIAFLAAASLGAVWSSSAPEFGTRSMVDRFLQVEPKVLIVAEAYVYGGRDFDLTAKRDELESGLPSLATTVVVPASSVDQIRADGSPNGSATEPGGSGRRRIRWADLLTESVAFAPERLPFDHPLWILYSSGTTGVPKAIMHSHGGIVLEHVKILSLHNDLGPGERFFWFTTTGWMMWNFLVGGLLVGATVVLYDGDPLWPDESRLWRMAGDLGVTYFGTSASFLETCRKRGLSPRRSGGLRIRTVGSTGSPLSADGFRWAAKEVGDDVLVASASGGTDVCTAFLTCSPLLPVRAGEIQCRALGVKVESYDEGGRPVVGRTGELVVTEPMPSMPIGMWGDRDGSLYHRAYFDEFPGVWRHGDWFELTSSGGGYIYGRSDATLNRGGVRTGTAEFYRIVESLPEVEDSLVVDTGALGGDGELILFVVPADRSRSVADSGPELDALIRRCLRQELSPRHVPDRVVAVPKLPHTITGKKLEVPVRRILLGTAPDRALSLGSLDDPDALDALLGCLPTRGGDG